MDRRSRRMATPRPLMASGMAFALTLAVMSGPARAQTAPPAGGSTPAAGQEKDQNKAKEKAAAKAKAKKKEAPPAAKDNPPARPPGEDFQAGIRKTVEQRRQRRARRGQAEGRPPGAIVPWPMPPALIIRQTPEVHDEIGSLLGQLRKG